MVEAMTWASPPAFLMPSATCSQASALRLEITTLAPSLASNSAEERPMPRLEPVTTATLPVRSNGVFFTFASLIFLGRHCEERKRRSNPHLLCRPMDCFAEPVIGRAFARPVGSQCRPEQAGYSQAIPPPRRRG